MNYLLHYNRLIDRALHRDIDGYYEKHHIIPRCIGGSNDATNIVSLTPEEHFVAHQLLVKIYPEAYKLANAAAMMCVKSPDNRRTNNKLFGWLRKKLAASNSMLQAGENSSQYGTCWIYNIKLKVCKKIPKSEVVSFTKLGWELGRILDFSKIRNCAICSAIIKGQNKTCSDICFKQYQSNLQLKKNPLYGRELEFLELHRQYNNTDKVLKIMGFPGNQAHWGRTARKLLKPN